jgi:propionyl-CoA synthetase
MGGEYEAVHARSLAEPAGFWAQAAEEIHWERKWDRVLDDSKAPFYRWFAGAVVNTCHNAIVRRVEESAGGARGAGG